MRIIHVLGIAGHFEEMLYDNAQLARVHLHAWQVTGDLFCRAIVGETLDLGFGQWLQALSYALSPPKEIAIVGEPDVDDTQALLAVAQDGYRPFQVVGLGAPSTQPSTVPLLQDRGLLDGQAAAYVCRTFACQVPVTEPEVLRAHLEQQ